MLTAHGHLSRRESTRATSHGTVHWGGGIAGLGNPCRRAAMWGAAAGGDIKDQRVVVITVVDVKGIGAEKAHGRARTVLTIKDRAWLRARDRWHSQRPISHGGPTELEAHDRAHELWLA